MLAAMRAIERNLIGQRVLWILEQSLGFQWLAPSMHLMLKIDCVVQLFVSQITRKTVPTWIHLCCKVLRDHPWVFWAFIADVTFSAAEEDPK